MTYPLLSIYPILSLPRLVDRTGDALVAWAGTRGLSVLATLAIALFALRFSTGLIDRLQAALQGNLRESSDRRNQRTLTLTSILSSTLRTAILFASALSLLAEFGINITPILASAGVVGLAVGFGAQSLVKDVIAGFFILFEDQYGVGDVVDIDGKSGLVERMNLRITQLRNQAGALITLPNGATKIVSNRSKEWARAIVELEVSFETDVDHVFHLMLEEGLRLRQEWPTQILEAPEAAGIQAFGDYGVQLKVVMKTAPLQQWAVASEWRHRIKLAFAREGIRFPRRMLHVATASPEEQASGRRV